MKKILDFIGRLIMIGIRAGYKKPRNIPIEAANPTIDSEYQDCSPEQVRAKELASQAVQLKDVRLPEAIKLLREAFDLWPENTGIAFRLARYLRLAGARDEAFSIYRKLSLAVNRDDYLMFGFNHEAILDEMMKQLFEEKNYESYLYYYFQKLWNTLLGLASQGRYEGIDKDIFLTYGAPTKIEKALKVLRMLDQQQEVAEIVFQQIQLTDADLRRISDISKANMYPSHEQVPSYGSFGERHLAALSQNQEFVALFGRLSSPTIADQIYKDAIASRMKQPGMGRDGAR